jgi:hypothetical protein
MRLQPQEKFEVKDSYEILASYEVVREVTNGITLDSSKVISDANGKKIVKKGQPLGKIDASGKYRPYGHTELASAAASTDTTLTLKDVSFLFAGDVINVNGTTVTIAADGVNRSTNVITLTAAVGVAKSTNDTVDLNDGAQKPTVVLKGQYDLTSGDHVAAGYEVAKVISDRIPVTVDQKLKDKMPNIVFA